MGAKSHTASENDHHRPVQMSQDDPQHIDNTGKTLDFAVGKPEKYQACPGLFYRDIYETRIIIL